MFNFYFRPKCRRCHHKVFEQPVVDSPDEIRVEHGILETLVPTQFVFRLIDPALQSLALQFTLALDHMNTNWSYSMTR